MAASSMYRLKVPDTKELGENDPHDVILSFDTTVSMAPFIQKLRDDLQEHVTSIFTKHPNTRIAIIAQGDYCSTYDIKKIDFTTDIDKLQEFVRSVENTNGGDYPECYELVLLTAKQMGWREGNVIKQLIMFGDAYPHDFEDFPRILEDPEYPLAQHQLDWKDEADELLQMGVKIIPMQYGKGKNERSDRFWMELAFKTRSWLIEVEDPEEVQDIITIAIYKGKGTNCLLMHVQEMTIPNGRNLPDSISLSLKRLEEAPGSEKAIALDTLKTPPTQCVEETVAESGRRKAAIAADRMSKGIIVTEDAKEQAKERINKMEEEIKEKEQEIERLREEKIKASEKAEKEMAKLKEELRKEKEKFKKELKNKDVDIEKRDRCVSGLGKRLKAKEEELEEKDAELEYAESERADLQTEKDDLEYTLDRKEETLSEQADAIERLEYAIDRKEKAEIEAAVLPKDDVSANNHAPALHKTKTSTVHSGTYNGCIKVAIKTMKLKNSIDQESLQEQMKLLPKLRHPNLVVVYGIENPFTNRESLTVVMELAEKCLQKTALSKSKGLQMLEKTVLKILSDAANGLAYLHSKDVVHCAVKPSNILIVGNTGKLSDIGFTSLTHDVESQYNAPELKQNLKAASPKSDVFALGVTILEALCHQAQTVDQPLGLASVGSGSNKYALISLCVDNDPAKRIKSGRISKKLTDMF